MAKSVVATLATALLAAFAAGKRVQASCWSKSQYSDVPQFHFYELTV
ncbi:MAG: hypothetical protein JWN11_1569 [Hyphomicrobiales bacterium]|nr:hypothetical protein [Hyphomicrobiales bacterium]